ncbi:STAS domain-containing protein [Nonomuraea sp. FMUSA5-5]|uniref:STAS domain-containing protein n=1 Tax=Nonomuraea composti TaxID=2720023 RepID=A0ABX1BAV5_9ACTN|nr:STAS domain-containing protein [Nonomuraea sp. FMUSA5-5]NJP92421.1 STAS domain-containing protein [Nonomuraea sp. FMUSA5-5]
MPLSLRLVPLGDVTLLLFMAGELDRSNRFVLADALESIPRSPVTYVVVAAGGLGFCDLGGFDQLSLTHRRLRVKGGRLVVADAQPPLRRLIELRAGGDGAAAIALYPSVAAALSATDTDGHPSAASAALAARPRHLPRVRALHPAQHPVQHPVQHSAQHPVQHLGQDPGPPVSASRVAPPRPSAPIAATSPVIAWSQALRKQAADQQQIIAERLGTARGAAIRLRESRRRCQESITALRGTLRDVQATLTTDLR